MVRNLFRLSADLEYLLATTVNDDSAYRIE
jgi:hypothetical protein